MATVEIERTPDDIPDSTSVRVLRPSRAARIRSIDPGEDLGTALRRARRRRRISLAQAARDTRIAARYITALERGAPLEEFPAPMYARAFLREYARYLRIETEPLLQLLAPYEPPPVALSLAVLRRAAPRSRFRGRLIALGAAAVLSVLLVLGAEEPLPKAKTPAIELDEPAPAAAPATDGVAGTVPAIDDVPGSSAPSGAIVAGLRTSGRSWLRITVDGEVVYEGIAASGWSRSFTGTDRVEILIGNAGALQLVVNGRTMGPLGVAGEVRRLLITSGNGGPVIRNLPRKS